jgi:hypothetical protein
MPAGAPERIEKVDGVLLWSRICRLTGYPTKSNVGLSVLVNTKSGTGTSGATETENVAEVVPNWFVAVRDF